METETKAIASLMKRTYYRGAWHGPSVKEVLADITPEMAHHRLPGSHSIIELVAHMTSWKLFVLKKLQGDEAFTIDDKANFPVVTEWIRVLQGLDEVHATLQAAVAEFDPARLYEKVPHASYDYSYYALLHGIIHHDLYHAGQLMLLKKDFGPSTI
jgi:uncharacterized damage-inducible protein DinB